MITYANAGARQFGMQGSDVRLRADWEFFAVVRGNICPVVAGQMPCLRASTLWVFPPGLAHDWVGFGEIIVAHATNVPALLRSLAEELAAQGRFIAIDLSSADRRQVWAIGLGLRGDLRRPDALSPIRQEKAILELSMIALAGMPTDLLPEYQPEPQRVVDLALAWCREHLATDASIAGAALAMEVSPAHLRRLFQRILKRSPRDILRDLRVRRAEELLRDRTRSLRDIAELCGFADPQSLSRAFRTVLGRPPRRPRIR